MLHTPAYAPGAFTARLCELIAARGPRTALEVARRLDNGVVVTILCDSASKYLSDRFWDEPDSACVDGDGI